METTHVRVIPYPAQGHVIPLMELSWSLADRGFRITFLNTEHNHDLLMGSGSTIAEVAGKDGGIDFVSISDGLESPEERTKPGKLSEAALTVLPAKVEELIDRIHRTDRIDSVVADQSLGWALEIAREKGLRCAAFCPAAAALLVQAFNTPRMIEDGIISDDGKILSTANCSSDHLVSSQQRKQQSFNNVKFCSLSIFRVISFRNSNREALYG